MKKIANNEIEELILGGRRKTVNEFNSMIDKFLQNKTEKEKNEIGDALADFYNDRIQQFIKIENEIETLMQFDTKEEHVLLLETA